VTRGTIARVAAIAIAVVAPVGGQRYTPPGPEIAPVAMAASCVNGAAPHVDTGAAWLLVGASAAARAAFDRAADLDPDCALAYWGQAVARFDAASEGSPDALAAVEMFARRAASVPAPQPFETQAIEALRGLVARQAAAGVPAAWPARHAVFRDVLCAGRTVEALRRRWCARALADAARRGFDGDAGARAIAHVEALGPLDAGLASIVLDAAPDARASIAGQAIAAIAAANPPAPAPHARAAVVAARRGEWAAAVSAVARVRGLDGAAVDVEVADAELEALLQLGKRADAYRLAGRAMGPPAEDGGAPARLAARAFARVVIADRRIDGRGLAELRALPIGERTAGLWPVVFATGLDEALRAWPGGNRERLARARTARVTLDTVPALPEDAAEIAWAGAVLEAVIDASQDEHQQMALLFTHAAELEARLTTGPRARLPLVPVRELAAELWLRTYRYDDARRDARAVLDAMPGRISPNVVLARAAARLQDREGARAAWATVLELRAAADADDSLRLEAERARAATP
jgi:hypothetical protein